MKTELKCFPCFIDDIIGGLELIEGDPEIRKLLTERVWSALNPPFDFEVTPSTYITKAHRVLKSYYGRDNLFSELRDKCNRAGIDVAQAVRREVSPLADKERFCRLVKWAIAGNELDFRTVGTGYQLTCEDFYRLLRETADKPLSLDESSLLFDSLPSVHRVLYVLDNVGEVALDALLIEEFLKMGIKVDVVYRGGAITSDVVLGDLDQEGITKLPVELVLAGPDTLGISFQEASPQFKSSLERADLTVAKGQANYYEFSRNFGSYRSRVVHLFRTKCDLVTTRFGFRGKVGIAAELREEFLGSRW